MIFPLLRPGKWRREEGVGTGREGEVRKCNCLLLWGRREERGWERTFRGRVALKSPRWILGWVQAEIMSST